VPRQAAPALAGALQSPAEVFEGPCPSWVAGPIHLLPAWVGRVLLPKANPQRGQTLRARIADARLEGSGDARPGLAGTNGGWLNDVVEDVAPAEAIVLGRRGGRRCGR